MLRTQIVTDFSDFPSAWKKVHKFSPRVNCLNYNPLNVFIYLFIICLLLQGQLEDTQNIKSFTALFDSSFDLSLKEKLWLLVRQKANGVEALFKD